jgi:ankyrin repeat protein
MNDQPNEILCLVFGYLDKLNLTIFRRINKKWKILIESKILHKEILPSIDECIITSDYYHMTKHMKKNYGNFRYGYQWKKYFDSIFDERQRSLISLVNNEIFTKFTYKPKWTYDKRELFVHYVTKGNLPVVNYLLDNGVNINYDNNQAIMLSILNGHLEITKFLFEKNANLVIYDYVFGHCAENGHLDVVKYLLEEKGMDPNANNDYAFVYSAQNGHFEIVKYLFEKNTNINLNINIAFGYSAKNGHIQIVKFLLENGADIHDDNEYALRCSVENQHIATVKYLLENGADANVFDFFNNNEKFSPIHYYYGTLNEDIIKKNKIEIIDLILKYNGYYQGNYKDNNNVIKWSAKHNRLDVIKLLINNKIDIHIDNECAFQISAENGHIEIVKFLLERKTNIHADNDYALRCSVNNKHMDIVKLLLKNGADPRAYNKFESREKAKGKIGVLLEKAITKCRDRNKMQKYLEGKHKEEKEIEEHAKRLTILGKKSQK